MTDVVVSLQLDDHEVVGPQALSDFQRGWQVAAVGASIPRCLGGKSIHHLHEGGPVTLQHHSLYSRDGIISIVVFIITIIIVIIVSIIVTIVVVVII